MIHYTDFKNKKLQLKHSEKIQVNTYVKKIYVDIPTSDIHNYK